MSVFDELRRLHAAEDFFEALEVEFDPAVVRVARLHILEDAVNTMSELVKPFIPLATLTGTSG